MTYKPLSTVTGWCHVCAMERRREKIAAEVQDLKEELEREQAAERGGGQALYSRKGRAKAKLKALRAQDKRA